MFNKSLLPYSKADYKSAYDKIEEFARKNPNLLILGQFGEVENPPISDLDVFVCYKDEGFARSKAQLLKFINEDESLKYFCWHEPVIIPQSMLAITEYLHSLYNLRFTYDSLGYVYQEIDRDYRKLLDMVWATFLVPIVFAHTEKVRRLDDRSSLLILKNVHQAICNLGERPLVMERSTMARNEYLSGNISIEGITSEMEIAGKQMLLLLSENGLLSRIDPGPPSKLTSFRLNRSVRLLSADESSVSSQGNVALINLSPKLWQIFLRILNANSVVKGDDLLSVYMKRAREAFLAARRTKSNYPFISPFGFPLNERYVISRMRRIAGVLL